MFLYKTGIAYFNGALGAADDGVVQEASRDRKGTDGHPVPGELHRHDH